MILTKENFTLQLPKILERLNFWEKIEVNFLNLFKNKEKKSNSVKIRNYFLNKEKEDIKIKNKKYSKKELDDFFEDAKFWEDNFAINFWKKWIPADAFLQALKQY